MATKKVWLLVDMPGMTYGQWNLEEGDELDLEAHQAEDIVRQGYAEPIGRKRKATK
jgi:hypothetical protein